MDVWLTMIDDGGPIAKKQSMATINSDECMAAVVRPALGMALIRVIKGLTTIWSLIMVIVNIGKL